MITGFLLGLGLAVVVVISALIYIVANWGPMH